MTCCREVTTTKRNLSLSLASASLAPGMGAICSKKRVSKKACTFSTDSASSPPHVSLNLRFAPCVSALRSAKARWEMKP